MIRVPSKKPAVLHEVPETGETALCNTQRGELLVLNDVGAAVWHLVDGKRTVAEIVEFVRENLEARDANVEGDVLSFLRELEARGLLGFGT